MGVGGPCVVLRMEGGGGGAPLPLPPLIDGVGPEEAEEVGTGTSGYFLEDVEAEGGLIEDGNSKRRPTATAGVHTLRRRCLEGWDTRTC
mmetsp:Transcript_2856/g.3146  ORF Transcript_2856/g.3146 Transcript_2856/m.3146 type:complete len:89 (+) Transcript_2856:358-624(+)